MAEKSDGSKFGEEFDKKVIELQSQKISVSEAMGELKALFILLEKGVKDPDFVMEIKDEAEKVRQHHKQVMLEIQEHNEQFRKITVLEAKNDIMASFLEDLEKVSIKGPCNKTRVSKMLKSLKDDLLNVTDV